MRWRGACLGLLLGAAVVLAGAQLVGAQVVERILIGDPTRTAHGLPPGLVVELASPAEYTRAEVRGMTGSWSGPRYQSRIDPNAVGNASIAWTVTFDERDGDAEAAAINRLRWGWARDQRGGLSVPHVVGKRVLGTLLGYFYLMTPGGPDARFEAVLAFPLGEKLYAVVHMEFLNPSREEFYVKNLVQASSWNRGQALLALSGVRLRGNLPPKVVSARAYDRGRIVRGRVVDRFLDPVIGAPVALERSSGAGWVRVARGRTNQRGFYSLGAGRRGTYRVAVNMAGFRAQSRPIRAGRRS